MARNSQNLGGVYANMDFPPYVYQEYPKHVHTGPHGQYEIAFSAMDEKEILARLQKEQDDAPAEVAPYVADPAKEILISRARELGVPFNSKWSKTKLQQVIQNAENDADDLPPENMEEEKVMRLTAQDDEVEAIVIQQPYTPEESVDVQKARLLSRAKALGINSQGIHLWGLPRLQAAIIEAEKNK